MSYQNSAINKTAPIRRLFKFHQEPLGIQKSSNTIYRERKKFHVFTKEELSRMARLGNLEEKAILLLGKDLGIKASDFVELKRSRILEAFEYQKEDFPIEFEIETKKGVIAIGHIMQETWEALQNYWNSKPQSEYVFSSNGSHIPENRVNYIIRNVWNRAYPDRQHDKTRFNEIRSFKMAALSESGINKWHIKRMVGKKLSSDISTYLREVNLKRDFRKAMPRMQLSSLLETSEEKIEELTITLMQTERETRTLKTRIDNLHNNIRRLEQLLRDSHIELQYITTKINDRLDWLEIQTKKKEKIVSI